MTQAARPKTILTTKSGDRKAELEVELEAEEEETIAAGDEEVFVAIGPVENRGIEI